MGDPSFFFNKLVTIRLDDVFIQCTEINKTFLKNLFDVFIDMNLLHFVIFVSLVEVGYPSFVSFGDERQLAYLFMQVCMFKDVVYELYIYTQRSILIKLRQIDCMVVICIHISLLHTHEPILMRYLLFS